MRLLQFFTFGFVLLLATSASAATKFYDASKNNGEPMDRLRTTATVCPPVSNTPDSLEGFSHITDMGSGTVTLEEHAQILNSLTSLGEDILGALFGPGSFIFVDSRSTLSISTPVVSNTSGIGGHGPSSTASGSSSEWGVVSGWVITGSSFCISSPVDSCNDNVGPHGMTTTAFVESTTYDLGTWNFDSLGDLEAENDYITRTSTGGLSNNRVLVQGAFHGASLPALPLVGVGALALGLAVMGGRALMGRR